MKFMITAILALSLFSLTACGDDAEQPSATDTSQPPAEAAQATKTAGPTDKPRPTDTPEPSVAGMSRQSPLPLGTSLLVPEGWEVTVLGVVDDAWPLVQAENPFNDPPEPGYGMFMVRVRGRNVEADDPADFDANFSFRLVGSANVAYTTFERSCGVVPDDFSSQSTSVFRGGEVEGSLCYQVREGETDLVLFTEFFLTFDEDSRRWFAVQ